MSYKCPENIYFIESAQEAYFQTLATNETSIRYLLGKQEKNIVTTSDILLLLYFSDQIVELTIDKDAYSRYEGRFTRKMLAILASRFWQTVEMLDLKLDSASVKRNVTLGTLPLGYLNGLTTKGPSGNYIILLNDGLFPLVRCLAEMFVMALEENESGFLIPSGDNLRNTLGNEKLEASFKEFWLKYFTAGSVEGCGVEDDGGHDPYRHEIRSCIVHSFFIFVLAHEYCHIFLGHLDEEDESQCVANKTDAKRMRNWGYELSCDLFATAITVLYDNHHTKKGVSLASLGIRLFFLIDEIVSPVKTVTQPSDVCSARLTHPPTDVRLKNCMSKICDMVSYSDYSVTVDVWNDVGQLFETWWNNKNWDNCVDEMRRILDMNVRRRNMFEKFIQDFDKGETKKKKVIFY